MAVYQRRQVGSTLGAWITPTLLNTWTDASGGGFGCVIAYRKTADGKHVEFTGIISGTLNTVAFNLPAGFRPITFKAHPITNLGGGSVVPCYIGTNGDVTPQASSSVNLDGVFFALDR
jgi:hypothetical protein